LQFLQYQFVVAAAAYAYFCRAVFKTGRFFAGGYFAALRCMKEPSEKRKRTLALHDRALLFTNSVNTACPTYFTNKPSAKAWINWFVPLMAHRII
jgi:hypothetical protein